MPDDNLTAALDEIRERSEVASKIMVSWKAQIQQARASADDVPRLLALADALLGLCASWDEKSREIAEQITYQDTEGAVAAFKMISTTGYEGRAKEVREAISRALLGEESGDA